MKNGFHATIGISGFPRILNDMGKSLFKMSSEKCRMKKKMIHVVLIVICHIIVGFI